MIDYVCVCLLCLSPHKAFATKQQPQQPASLVCHCSHEP